MQTQLEAQNPHEQIVGNFSEPTVIKTSTILLKSFCIWHISAYNFVHQGFSSFFDMQRDFLKANLRAKSSVYMISIFLRLDPVFDGLCLLGSGRGADHPYKKLLSNKVCHNQSILLISCSMFEELRNKEIEKDAPPMTTIGTASVCFENLLKFNL